MGVSVPGNGAAGHQHNLGHTEDEGPGGQRGQVSRLLEEWGESDAGVCLSSMTFQPYGRTVQITQQGPADCHGCHHGPVGAIAHQTAPGLRLGPAWTQPWYFVQTLCWAYGSELKAQRPIQSYPVKHKNGGRRHSLHGSQDKNFHLTQVGPTISNKSSQQTLVNAMYDPVWTVVVDHNATLFFWFCSPADAAYA